MKATATTAYHKSFAVREGSQLALGQKGMPNKGGSLQLYVRVRKSEQLRTEHGAQGQRG